MTPEDEKALREVAGFDQLNDSIIPPLLARAILELRDRLPSEWPIDGGPAPIPPPSEYDGDIKTGMIFQLETNNFNPTRGEEEREKTKAMRSTLDRIKQQPQGEGLRTYSKRFGCIGSACQIGTLNRLGCVDQCELEILADRGLVQAPIPKLPTLGGYWSPQTWLRNSAIRDRSRQAYARAREAVAIADWIDAVVATPLTPSTPEFAEVDEEEQCEEGQGEPGNATHDSRACVRDELAEIVTNSNLGRAGNYEGAQTLVDRVLDTLIERARPFEPAISVRSFLDLVKDGSL